MNIQTRADLIVASTALLRSGRSHVLRATRSRRGVTNSTVLTTTWYRLARDIADVQSTIRHVCARPAGARVATRPVYKVQ